MLPRASYSDHLLAPQHTQSISKDGSDDLSHISEPSLKLLWTFFSKSSALPFPFPSLLPTTDLGLAPTYAIIKHISAPPPPIYLTSPYRRPQICHFQNPLRANRGNGLLQRIRNCVTKSKLKVSCPHAWKSPLPSYEGRASPRSIATIPQRCCTVLVVPGGPQFIPHLHCCNSFTNLVRP
jgi:hypothetical protein